MPFYRKVRSRSSTRPRREGLTFGFKLSDLFRSRKTRVVRIVEEAPVRRRTQEYPSEGRPRPDSPSPRPIRRRGEEHTRVVHFRDDSPSPPPVRRATRNHPMMEENQAPRFTPLPPMIRKSSSYDSDDDRGFDIEDRAPSRKTSKSYRKKPNHKRKDSKLEREPEIIEVPSSPRRLRESDAERARRKQAERDAADAIYVATQHADVAYQERKRREEVEDLGRTFERAYIDERDVRLDAVRKAKEAQARADDLTKQLDKEKRDKRYLERTAELLSREKRVAEEQKRVAEEQKRVAEEQERIARIRSVLRPVDLHQEPPLNTSRDPGSDAIRRAQEDARRREQHMRDDDHLFGRQREQRKNRRGSQIIFDDDVGRRGYRRD